MQIKRDPFWPQRETKNNLEVKQITESLRIARLGLEAGIRMLKRTKTKRDGYLYLNGTRLTSEMLKTAVNTTIMAQGWLPSHTIISSGNQCVDPHHEGTRPDQSQHLDHLRYLSALATQWLLRRLEPHRGARPRVGKTQRDLRHGASRAADRLRRRSATASTAKKSTKIFSNMFAARGFPTGRINGRMQGFFHGTGHGLGLDIHEPPRIAPVDAILRTGHVVTVEPGLYYSASAASTGRCRRGHAQGQPQPDRLPAVFRNLNRLTSRVGVRSWQPSHREIAALIAALDHPDKPTIRAAVDKLIALAETSETVRQALHDRLSEADHRNYWPVAYVLGHQAQPSGVVIRTLLDALDHREPDIRWANGLLLVRIAQQVGAVVTLLTELCATGSANQKRMALYCLRDLALNDDQSRAAMLQSLEDQEPTVRVAAATSLKVRTDVDAAVRQKLLADLFA